MIWHSITTGNRKLASVSGNVGCFHPDIAPFAAVRQWDDANIADLYDFIPPERAVAISYPSSLDLDPSRWKFLQKMAVTQMAHAGPVLPVTAADRNRIVPLGDRHVPEMIALTELTRPGPFLQRTILFGNYFGIFEGGRLVAMAGQRMNPLPYMEVSAVCTHPDFRGRGYARAIMLHVMSLIAGQGLHPFLHVVSANTRAIELYRSIGFSVYRTLHIDVVKKL